MAFMTYSSCSIRSRCAVARAILGLRARDPAFESDEAEPRPVFVYLANLGLTQVARHLHGLATTPELAFANRSHVCRYHDRDFGRSHDFL